MTSITAVNAASTGCVVLDWRCLMMMPMSAQPMTRVYARSLRVQMTRMAMTAATVSTIPNQVASDSPRWFQPIATRYAATLATVATVIHPR